MIWIGLSFLIVYLLLSFMPSIFDKKPSFDVSEVCTELKKALTIGEVNVECNLNQNSYLSKLKIIYVNGDFLNSLHATAVVLHEFGHFLTIKKEHSFLEKIAKAMFFIAFILLCYFMYSIVDTFFFKNIDIAIIHYIAIVFISLALFYYIYTIFLELKANMIAIRLQSKMDILESEHKYICLCIIKSFMIHFFNLLFYINLFFIALQLILR